MAKWFAQPGRHPNMTWLIASTATEIHVAPMDDLWHHNALDGREAYETGERLPS